MEKGLSERACRSIVGANRRTRIGGYLQSRRNNRCNRQPRRLAGQQSGFRTCVAAPAAISFIDWDGKKRRNAPALPTGSGPAG